MTDLLPDSPHAAVTNLLSGRDYTLIIARTAKPITQAPPGYEQRWMSAQSAIHSLAKQCEAFDPDGINLYVSCRNQPSLFRKCERVTPGQLDQIFTDTFPPDSLELLPVLEDAIDSYFARKTSGLGKPGGEMILALLDGEPDDRMAVSRAIVHATEKMERDEELAIGLIQIGDDLLARGFFNALDDNLKSAGAKFDIVNTSVLEDVKSESLIEFLVHVLKD